MKIAYVDRHPLSYPRLVKQCNSLARAGHDVTVIGWAILPNDEKSHDLLPQVKKAVLRLRTTHGKFELLKWLRYYWHVVRHVAKGNFDVVHCVNEYPVLLLFPFKHVFYRRIVLDVWDSVIKRKAANRMISASFHFARWLANTVSDRIIETSDELCETLGRFQSKAIVMYNAPEDPGAWVEGVLPAPEGPVQLAVTGTIHSGGVALDTLVKALNALGPERVRVRCSGRLLDGYAREQWIRHPCVSYEWFDRNEDYFRLVAQCDLVYNVRADAENSYYRSLVFPQKVFDALAVGRPVIVASENWVKTWVETNELGYSCSFKDAAQMADIIAGCRARRVSLPAFAKRARDLFKSQYSWAIMEKRLIAMYAGLNVRVPPAKTREPSSDPSRSAN